MSDRSPKAVTRRAFVPTTAFFVEKEPESREAIAIRKFYGFLDDKLGAMLGAKKP